MQSSNLRLPYHLADPEKSLPKARSSSLNDGEPPIKKPMPSPESSTQSMAPPGNGSKQVAEHINPPTLDPDITTAAPCSTRKVTFIDTATQAQTSSSPQAALNVTHPDSLPNPRTLPVLLGRSNYARWHAALSPVVSTFSTSLSLPPDDLTNLRLCRFIRATLAMNVLPHVQLQRQAGRLWEKLNELYGEENGISAVGGPRARMDVGRGLSATLSLGGEEMEGKEAAGHKVRTGREVVEVAGLAEVAEEVNATETVMKEVQKEARNASIQ